MTQERYAIVFEDEHTPTFAGTHTIFTSRRQAETAASNMERIHDGKYTVVRLEDTDDSNPRPEDYRCEWVDYHSDMYPEFAPDPIEQPCTEQAVTIVVGWDVASPQADPFAHRACEHHAQMWLAYDEADTGIAVMVRVDKPGYVKV